MGVCHVCESTTRAIKFLNYSDKLEYLSLPAIFARLNDNSINRY